MFSTVQCCPFLKKWTLFGMVFISNPNIVEMINKKYSWWFFYFLPENSRISKKFVVRTKSCHYFHTFLLRYIFVVSILLSNSSACFSFQIIFVSFSCSTHLLTIDTCYVFCFSLSSIYALFRNLCSYSKKWKLSKNNS